MASYFKVMQDGREVEFSFYLNNLVVRVPYTNGYFSLVGETSDSIGSVTIVSTKDVMVFLTLYQQVIVG